MTDAVKTKVDELREALKAKKEAEERVETTRDEGRRNEETKKRGTRDETPAISNAVLTNDRRPTTDDEVQKTSDQRPATSDDLTVQIRAAEEEAKAHYDKLLRVMAEFENFKKRTERERIEAITFANQRLMEELLPVLDHLDEALANVEATPNGNEAVRSLSEGVELTRRQFLGIVARHGLEPIEPTTGMPFDPTMHEAMAQIDAEGVSAGSVVARHRRGYRLHGRVLRPALVSVAK